MYHFYSGLSPSRGCSVFCKVFFPYIISRIFISDVANIKILNAGAWSRRTEKIPVSLPSMLEDLISDVEEFHKKNHTGRKLNWNHLLSHGIVSTMFFAYTIKVCTCNLG